MEALQAAKETVDANLDRTESRDPWDAVYNPSMGFLGDMGENPPPEPDRITEVLYRALNASKAANPRIFADRMRNFLEGEQAQVGLYGGVEGANEETAAERFSRVFSTELRDVDFRRKLGSKPISDEEFKAALENRPQPDESTAKKEEPLSKPS